MRFCFLRAERDDGDEMSKRLERRAGLAGLLSIVAVGAAMAAGLAPELGVTGFAGAMLCVAISTATAFVANLLDKRAAGLYLGMLPLGLSLVAYRVCFLSVGHTGCSPGVLPGLAAAVLALAGFAMLAQWVYKLQRDSRLQ